MAGPTVTARQLELDHARSDVVDSVWHEPPDGTAVGGTVVLAHGAGGNLDDGLLQATGEALALRGHRVVRVNLPYRQLRAKGPPPRAESSVDDWAAVRSAVATAVDHPVVIGGKSYGGRVASLLAARDVTDTVGLLCLSYPLHPPGRPDRLRVDHLPAITVPIAVVQGTADPFGGPSELQPHVEQVQGGATVFEVVGGNHGLHVPRTKSPDGNTHRVERVLAAMAPRLGEWLDGLAPAV